MNKIKKIATVILVLVMAFSSSVMLTSCDSVGDLFSKTEDSDSGHSNKKKKDKNKDKKKKDDKEDDEDEETEETTEETTEEITEETTVETTTEATTEATTEETTVAETTSTDDESDTYLGTVDGGVYTNEFYGFAFDGNGEWTFQDVEDYMSTASAGAELMDIEDWEEIVENSGTIMLLVATSDVDIMTNIQVQACSSSFGSFSMDNESICQSYADMLGEQMASILDFEEDSLICEAVQLKFMGEDIWVAHIEYPIYGMTIDTYQSYFELNDTLLMLNITTSPNSSVSLDDILGCFKELN